MAYARKKGRYAIYGALRPASEPTISVAARVRLCFHGAVAARASPMSSTNALRYSRTIARSIVCSGRDGGKMVEEVRDGGGGSGVWSRRWWRQW